MMQHIFSHLTLQSLYEAARKVLDEGKSPEVLREALEQLELMAQFRESSGGKGVLEQARARYAHTSGEYEVAMDDGTIIDYNDNNGYWVMAWCFVNDGSVDGDAEDD